LGPASGRKKGEKKYWKSRGRGRKGEKQTQNGGGKGIGERAKWEENCQRKFQKKEAVSKCIRNKGKVGGEKGI